MSMSRRDVSKNVCDSGPWSRDERYILAFILGYPVQSCAVITRYSYTKLDTQTQYSEREETSFFMVFKAKKSPNKYLLRKIHIT